MQFFTDMKNLFFLVFYFQLPLLASEPVIVEKGLSVTIPIPAAGHIQSNNSKIIMLQDLGSRLRILGKDLGKTEILLENKKLEVVVLSSSNYQVYEALKDTLRPLKGLELSIEDKNIRVVGELFRVADWIRLSSAVKGLSGRYQFAAKIGDDLKSLALKMISDHISQGKLPLPTVALVPQAKIFIPSSDKSLLQAYEDLLRSFGFDVQENSKGLSLEPLIEVKVLVAEIKKKFFYRFGIKWPSVYSADLLKSNEGVRNLLSLNALEENGLGKILASPVLQCRSGKEASFLAGGEFPIKIANFKTNDVIWKKYGVMLNFKPVADFSGRMSIAIETEISNIDTSQSVDGVPGILTNRIRSHFDLEKSETIALSGLIRNDFGQSQEGLPLLTKIPILGILFSSKDYREEKTELIVFVTPTVKL